ncbi:bifunctional methionine sulfoxide reductase B/A protein [Legionella dresdenensis]|uniref:Peptide methionine sulfoxide reductase MsrA n=1 Tax=Legionella dresdenensis TaxID=450200 RepID=A0ABV8CDT0_9GAMM
MAAFVDKINSLTPAIKRIICYKATEYPFTGQYNKTTSYGTYLCRRCGLALFRSDSQFHSNCGWPSFDESILKTVAQVPDPDGERTEITCSRCAAHLGHVFTGENFTAKNLRHCVNSAALDLVAGNQVQDTEEAIVAGGCFWGIEHFMRQIPGVLKVEVGYIGGIKPEPTYEEVCSGLTRHYEAARIVFDNSQTNYHTVIKRFFEIHDPTQRNGQGPDIGSQYESAIFYYNLEQLTEIQDLIALLKKRGYQVATSLRKAVTFWPAEDYHQAYYSKQGTLPYCHHPADRFG